MSRLATMPPNDLVRPRASSTGAGNAASWRRRGDGPMLASGGARRRRSAPRRAPSGSGACANRPTRSCKPPIRPRRKKHTSSTKTMPKHQLPGAAEPEHRLQEIAQIEPDRGAEQRAEQRADAADRGLHHQLAGGVEGERVGRHEALQHAEQPAGKAGIGRGDDERGQLVEADRMADRARPQRIVADRASRSRRPASARCAARSPCRRSSRRPGSRTSTSRCRPDRTNPPKPNFGVGTPGSPFSPPVQADSGEFSTKKNISAIATVIIAK